MPVLAAIDIGANSVRMKIAGVEGRRLRVIAEDREVTRLGEAVFREGRLAPAAMDHTLRVLRRFQRAVREHAVDRLRVVGTSPLRDATNAEEFVTWVRAALGWRVEIITGLEEGRLIHLGVVSRVRTGSGVLLIDLGGGSCELTLSRGGHILAMHSLPLGAVRLTGEFLDHDPPKKAELERMRAYIREELAAVAGPIRRARVGAVLATSGTAAALAASLAERNERVRAAAVRRLANQLSRMRSEQRQKVVGIGTRRTEIIVAGAWVFAEIMEAIPLPAFRYLPLGLRDGMLAQMVAERAGGGSLRRRLETDRGDALLALCRHYEIDLPVAEQVRTLVVQLFRRLQTVHGLPPEYREWLEAAALLHEVGAFINHAGRHRHARYIVANAEIFGFTPRQRLVIANLVRFLGRTQPAPSDPGLQSLGEQAALIPRAVALLRLARALNQGRRGAVADVRARVGRRRVHLRLRTGRGGAPLELWAVAKEAAYFRRVFGRSLTADAA